MSDYETIILESPILQELSKGSILKDTLNLFSNYNDNLEKKSSINKEVILESIMSIKEVC